MDRREFLLGSALAALPAFAKSGAPQGSPESHAGRIRIAHLTDPQFGFDWTPQDNEAKYAADLARFERAVARVNDIKPDLVLITGDMTHKAEDLSRDWPRLLGMFKVPVVVAPGNHDMGQKVSKENRDRYLSVFGSDYQSLDVKGWRVIVGNTQFWYKTELVDEQLKYEEWLKAELEKAKLYDGRVILAGHIPPFAHAFDEGNSYENYPKEGREVRLLAYRNAGVKFYICGHTHRMSMHGYKDLTILNAETTSLNFDRRPFGFRLFDAVDECDWSYKFVKV